MCGGMLNNTMNSLEKNLFDMQHMEKSLQISHLFNNIIYIITQVILAFQLILAYDLLEDRRIDDDSTRFKFFLNFLNFEFEPITILC